LWTTTREAPRFGCGPEVRGSRGPGWRPRARPGSSRRGVGLVSRGGLRPTGRRRRRRAAVRRCRRLSVMRPEQLWCRMTESGLHCCAPVPPDQGPADPAAHRRRRCPIVAVTATSAAAANAALICPDVSSYNHDSGATVNGAPSTGSAARRARSQGHRKGATISTRTPPRSMMCAWTPRAVRIL
jgi:hypothetical protein